MWFDCVSSKTTVFRNRITGTSALVRSESFVERWQSVAWRVIFIFGRENQFSLLLMVLPA